MTREFEVIRPTKLFNKVVGYVNSSVRTGEYFAVIKGTDSTLSFADRDALCNWIDNLGLKLR